MSEQQPTGGTAAPQEPLAPQPRPTDPLPPPETPAKAAPPRPTRRSTGGGRYTAAEERTASGTGALGEEQARRLEEQARLLEEQARLLEEALRRAQTDNEQLRRELEDCEERASSGRGQDVTYQVALEQAADAYNRAFEAIGFALASGSNAIDVVYRQMRSGRLSQRDAERVSPFTVFAAAGELGVQRTLAGTITDLEPLLFDAGTALPKPVAILYGPIKEYADGLCACQGEPIWAEAALLGAFDRLREVLVADWSAMAHVQSHAIAGVYAAAADFLDELPNCPPAGAVGGVVERVALWAGEPPDVARRLQRWHDLATQVVGDALGFVVAGAGSVPTTVELSGLARQIALLTATPSPVCLPLVRSDRSLTAGARVTRGVAHSAAEKGTGGYAAMR